MNKTRVSVVDLQKREHARIIGMTDDRSLCRTFLALAGQDCQRAAVAKVFDPNFNYGRR